MMAPFTKVALASLRFAWDLPTWLIVMIAVLLGGATVWLYSRETRTLDGAAAWTLPALRGTAIILIVLLLAGPIWHHRQTIGQPARLIFAVDQSLSMSERDSSDGLSPDRLKRAAELLFGRGEQSGWIEQLKQTHLIDVVSFDSTAQTRWKSYDVDDDQTLESSHSVLGEATGVSTNLSAALRPLVPTTDADTSDDAIPTEQLETGTPLALVMLSDGRDSANVADASDLAWQLSQTGWQIHTIGMGSIDEPADIGIINVLHPERIASDGRLTGTIVAKHFGVLNETLRINLRSGDQVVWSESIVATEDGQTEVDFEFPVETLSQRLLDNESRGVDHDSLVLPFTATISRENASVSASKESPRTDGNQLASSFDLGQSDNDRWDFRVAAANRDRRLLILDGSSRWETRYLRNLFARDPAWEVDTVLIGAGTDMPNIQRGDQNDEVPQTETDWGRYDAIVFGEVPPEQWTDSDSEGLKGFVKRGGGLILLDGRYNRLSRIESLSDLIPVNFEQAPTISDNTALLRYQKNQPLVKSIGPSTAGRSQPVMLLAAGTDNNEELWRAMPTPNSIPPITARADAEVWADAIVEPTPDGQNDRVPWLVTRLFGAGRVFYLATDQTWRWRYKVESQLHGRFWNQLLTAVMPPPYAVRDDYVAIGTDQIDYSSGQKALIRARLLDTDALETDASNPSTATVDAILIRDDQIFATIPLNLDNAARKTYLGQTPPLPPGAYRVRIRASGYDASALKASAPIWVESAGKGELDRVAVDESRLKEIASAGAGTYVHESSAEEMLNQLIPLSRGQIIETDTLLWESWWLFVVVLLLLAAEWWMRKRSGLI
ncbi:vWA domain-containing protein [Rhodopirellula halodulae]|uniref:vWA domain-containing protein n=1 Tax=Rhodopirellula halodulae TaxID=2894198 RepID=UPI001E5BC1A3|nr:vWA domain-containing protein [Rhodopirellula sp. JC737]MCC9657851.1 VWA domain-containing protein [Rhodopirellula sp. JC737]